MNFALGLSLKDFDYVLPKEFIAPYPVPKRSEARLLVLDRRTHAMKHRIFRDLPESLRPGDLLVLNNTKVLPARIFGRKPTGGRVEALLLKSLGENSWQVLMKPSRRVKKGSRISFGENGAALEGEILDEPNQTSGLRRIRFGGDSIREKLNQIGRIPLPPYLDRPDEAIDRELYQTVFAEVEGAVASPTAGLHFDEELLETLRRKGTEIAFVTLHVGYGTFQPVQTEDLAKHKMEEEEFEVSGRAAQQIKKAKEEGRRVIACGTTVVRTLETWYRFSRTGSDEPVLKGTVSGEKCPPENRYGRTTLFICPPYEFKVVDAMITNFHLPRSTLLMLASAFTGHELLLKAYQEAIRERYRFYSYGDAMLIT